MNPFDISDNDYERLQQRVGRVHLNQRLGIETDYEGRVFGQGRNFFHLENWVSGGVLIRGLLRASLLHGRGRRNARTIRLRAHEFRLSHLPHAFDGYRILHISDLHLDMASDMDHALVDAIRPVEYDLCVLTGDFRALTSGPHTAAMQAMERVRLHLPDPVYAILGNHDSIRMVLDLEDMGIQLLLNEHVRLERDGAVIYLAGIDDPHYFRADNLEKAAEEIPVDVVSVLLAHSPEIYRHAAHAEFDVMLCGHTHGGQICLPGGLPLYLNASCPRRYCRGAWRYGRLHGYTSTGSGSSIVDVRLNCPPEITLHRLWRAPVSDQ